MESKLEYLLNNRSLYKSCYFIFLSLNMIQFFNVTVISRVLLAFFMLWGLYVCLREVTVKRARGYFHINMKMLIGMLGFCVISYIYNWENRGAYNLFSLIFFGLCVLVMYPNPDKAETGIKEMISIAKAYAYLSIAASGICIYMFLNQTQFLFEGRGAEIRIGVWENRLFGIFSSPNVGGTFFSIGIYLSLFLLYSIKSGQRVSAPWKYICYLNIFMASWYIVLSLSRGTYLSLFSSLTAGLVLYKIPRYKNQPMGWRFLGKTGIFILAVMVISLFSSVMRTFSQYMVTRKIQQEISFERIEYGNTGGNVEEEQVAPQTEEANVDPSNKRFAIWSSSVTLASETLLTGVGNSYHKLWNMKPEEREFLTEYERMMINYSAGNIHNGYLQIFVCCGLPALTAYILFLLSSLARVIRSFPHIRGLYMQNCCVYSFAIVVYILINNLFESNMALMGANSFQAAMWTFAGYVILFCNAKRKGASL